jgi:UDP-N-acetylglucosamine 1-carboxyvinyltransferase
MIASLLTDQTLILDNVPRLADVNLLQRILSNHGVDMMVPASARASRRTSATPFTSFRCAHRRHHGALRSRLQDARELLGGRAAARRMGEGKGIAAGRLRHRHPAGRPADHGAGAARAEIEIDGGYVIARAKSGLKGGEIVFPKVTVGGTHTALMAAVARARRRPVIENSAREPEVVRLSPTA